MRFTRERVHIDMIDDVVEKEREERVVARSLRIYTLSHDHSAGTSKGRVGRV